ETKRILSVAEGNRIKLKLIGGLGVWYHCKESPRALKLLENRKYPDIDVVGHKKQAPQIKKLFTDLRYTPRVKFNAIYGDRRLIFNDLERKRRVDIFLDVFEMCHALNLREAIDSSQGMALGVTHLLMTKLQIVEITEKDLLDIICLLMTHEVSERDNEEVVSLQKVCKITSNDWGIYKTFTINLEKIKNTSSKYLSEEEVRTIKEKIELIVSKMESEPKTIKWKLRAQIGEKVRWYELPEPDVKIA
ncbi:MAG: hypothetical protein ACPLN2_09250, partial [Thermoproteota archaeon]